MFGPKCTFCRAPSAVRPTFRWGGLEFGINPDQPRNALGHAGDPRFVGALLPLKLKDSPKGEFAPVIFVLATVLIVLRSSNFTSTHTWYVSKTCL